MDMFVALADPTRRTILELLAVLDPLQAGWMVPRDSRGNGADGSSDRGTDEADPDVPALYRYRAEAGRLASAAHQARRAAPAGL